MTDEAVDYTTMSGAEFRRAVGADPVKWAAAFRQLARLNGIEIGQDMMGQWFTDAMDAARAEARRFHRIGEEE